ncbi:TVP38/TMEM64 family protein [Streptomyces sp. NBC_00237]|uniref:TVP38/TMEM64 family protein n=1 Tax=Streptomyces sp. NBC_00237 TaxID=2975687 RepID=UPI002256E1B0|nr:TVP38/TMEM64 family protein [Streptomyces sp. NBC_00237]MCX5206836.1 TVP38/TMEM64 family protein [Streptomyces sp. NBC_00237]
MFDHATGATARTDAPHAESPCAGRPDAGGPGTDRSGTGGPTRGRARADAPGTGVPRASVRFARVLLSPWARLALLLVVLASAATAVLLYEPQKMLADGWPPQLGGAMAAVLFGVAYGLCTVAFVPRPILNLAAGALFGTVLGLTTSIGGTVLGAGISFALGRYLGQDALRPMLRGRVLLAADGVLSRHGFRSMLAIRLFPGVPFAAANYCAAVSRMRYLSFLTATGLGSIPNTLAYVIAGSEASSPTSPAFVISTGFIVVSSIAGVVVAWRKRHSIGRSAGEAASDTAQARGAGAEKTPVLPLSNK